MSQNRAAKHTFFNFLTIGFNAFQSLVLTAVTARWLAPEGMGTYSLVTWFFTVAGILVNLGFVTTTMKYMAEALGRDDAPEAGGILAYGLRQLLINAAVVTVLWCLSTPWVSQLYGRPALSGLMPIAAMAILPVSAMALLTAACQGLQKYGQVALTTGIYTLLMVAGTLGVLACGLGIGGLLAVMGLAAAVACGFYLIALVRWQPGWWALGVSPERRGSLRRYGGSLMVLILLDAIVWQRSGVFFLGLWSPAEQVAFFAMSFALATMAMRMIPGTLVGLLIPSMSRHFGSGNMAEVARIYRTAGRWMAILAMPVAVGGAVLGHALVTTLYGMHYAPMAPILSVMLVSGALVMTFGFPASSVLYAVEGQGALVRIGCGVAVANLLLAVWLIPLYGALGAAVATAVAQALSLIPGAWVVSRKLPGARPDIERLPRVLAAAAVMGVPVGLLAMWLPPVLALAAGVPLGALAYALALWLFAALAPEDEARVFAIASRLPVLNRWVPIRPVLAHGADLG